MHHPTMILEIAGASDNGDQHKNHKACADHAHQISGTCRLSSNAGAFSNVIGACLAILLLVYAESKASNMWGTKYRDAVNLNEVAVGIDERGHCTSAHIYTAVHAEAVCAYLHRRHIYPCSARAKKRVSTLPLVRGILPEKQSDLCNSRQAL